MLLDAEWEGEPRKLVVTANRNAFYYVLDRETGEFLHGREYSKQTWAEGLDENGRPIVIPGTDPTEEGVLVWPSLQGAANWFSPSYSPRTGLFYQPTRIMGAVYFKADVEYVPGQPYTGGGEQALRGEEASGAIKALDALTGELVWEFPLLSPALVGCDGDRRRPRLRRGTTKATSSPWTRRPASPCGTSSRAAPCAAARCPTRSTAGSAS